MAGKPWYTNGIVEIQISVEKGEIVPDGFYRGRKPISQEENELRLLKYREKMSLKTQEELDEINSKRSLSLHNTYLKKSEEEKKSIINKRITTMTNKSEEEKLQYRKKLSDNSIGKNKGKEPWNKSLTKEDDSRMYQLSLEISDYMKNKYSMLKLTNPQYIKDWRMKVARTMKEHNSYIKSKPEEDLYLELIEEYGKDNVIRQYKDERYPFYCDFYIPSEDLFIELNRFWTHGSHPFDSSNIDDIEKLHIWQELSKISDFYKNAIYVWTQLDVKKFKIAQENNLNYKVIY